MLFVFAYTLYVYLGRVFHVLSGFVDSAPVTNVTFPATSSILLILTEYLLEPSSGHQVILAESTSLIFAFTLKVSHISNTEI
jgi:hypothetical protein